jgi:hypothetical protein
MKIFEDYSKSKNIVFRVKKLLNDGVYLTLRLRGKKKRWSGSGMGGRS